MPYEVGLTKLKRAQSFFAYQGQGESPKGYQVFNHFIKNAPLM